MFRLLDHPGQGMHLDMHDLWIDPANPDRLLLGTDGGLYVSHDRARTYLHLNNLPIAEFYTVHIDGAEPFNVWGGTQDNASLHAPGTASLDDLRTDDWSYVFLDPWDGGDGFATFPCPSGDGTVYYEQQNGDMKRKAPGAGLRWGRGTGRRITPRAGEGEPPLRFEWNTPLFPSAHDATVLYCGSQFAMRSKDRGESWERISGDLTGGRGGILSLAESPLDPSRMIAGAERGRVSLTADGGASWSDAGEALPRVEVASAALSHHSPERAWVALSGQRFDDRRAYAYRSDDFGASWADVSSNLPDAPVNVIVEDPLMKDLVFAGTDLGVYVSKDAGATWAALSSGMPTAPVENMALHGESGTLVAVTHGLSAFALEIQALR